ncbi:MAG TPA: phosphoglycerate mutase family protein [Candidatus Cloacimonadota bacterium]|nr:phosphoglycerate mutase family protein [Candidatus Cloacimonadota bacterium]HOQ79870.1 phosphoglycerate mutase family protein [Candidatus Cloacimonadota bacterium]
MKIYILRHGEAEHLLEDWSLRISYNDFIESIYRWGDSELTENGVEQCKDVAKELEGKYSVVFSSPLERTKETAKIVNISKRPIYYEDNLQEITMKPPFFLKGIKLSTNMWIATCVIKSLYSFLFIKQLKEIRDLYRLFFMSGEKGILVVSHSARIHALLLYAVISKYWKLKSKNIKPCGVSLVEFTLEGEPIKQKGETVTDL